MKTKGQSAMAGFVVLGLILLFALSLAFSSDFRNSFEDFSGVDVPTFLVAQPGELGDITKLEVPTLAIVGGVNGDWVGLGEECSTKEQCLDFAKKAYPDVADFEFLNDFVRCQSGMCQGFEPTGGEE